MRSLVPLTQKTDYAAPQLKRAQKCILIGPYFGGEAVCLAPVSKSRSERSERTIYRSVSFDTNCHIDSSRRHPLPDKCGRNRKHDPLTVAIPSWLPVEMRGILSDLNTGAITTRVPLQARAHSHQHAPMRASKAKAFHAELVIIFDGNSKQHQLHPLWPPQSTPLVPK